MRNHSYGNVFRLEVNSYFHIMKIFSHESSFSNKGYAHGIAYLGDFHTYECARTVGSTLMVNCNLI